MKRTIEKPPKEKRDMNRPLPDDTDLREGTRAFDSETGRTGQIAAEQPLPDERPRK